VDNKNGMVEIKHHSRLKLTTF